ncbi:MAG: guanylate kinase [Candidatus Electrothrix sp. AX5]|jgi:guanylate kinase|uniref:Guanylate kinase n=1 Tax=Candidatus Electrothrix aarhusensis TaxID=1859131 RepID=A0A444IQF5_9BACT|nr:guanylate kinase [Candidatus Electrothrix sp. AX5]RWX43027.1 guanylate kinase [Candidatus Electrothrix aarhusensis]
MAEGILLVVSAPSGCGKTTILKQVMAKVSGLDFSVSHTTRQPRVGELDGVDYHFVSKEEFLALRDQQPSGFLEWAEVHGNFYGTSRRDVEALLSVGKDVVLDIDIQGAEQVRKNADPVTIFISPPTLAELERRLRGRGTESPENLTVRLANAEKEMAAADNYRYLIINDILEQAIRDLQAIITAERRRRNTAQVNRTVPRS